MKTKRVDVAIVGGGAAGLMAAIWAARTNPQLNIIILDGSKKLGAKILVAGGGRCNVTHYSVSPEDFAGASQNSIKKVLLRFEVEQTIEFFNQIGVQLKREETGKLFPVTDSARDVLKALLDQANNLGVHIYCHHRIENINKMGDGFAVEGHWGRVVAKKLIMATGGKSLPKSGSDGKGYELVKKLGHTTTQRIFPALVPLLLPENHFIRQISGVSLVAKLSVLNRNNKCLVSFTDSLLCTHFGLSGPAVLDISRYWLAALNQDDQAILKINWVPDYDKQTLTVLLLNSKEKRTIRNVLTTLLPVRLVDHLCALSGVELSQKCNQLSKSLRDKLIESIIDLELPIVGDRGFQFAEVTAGGVPLTEVNLKSMQSRICSGLYFCGEICDVDGRIGGFNFQWAWASGYICGLAVAKAD